MTAPSPSEAWDVAIVGGGLAGLTLALQLRRRFDDLRILVLERRAHPVPVAAHKVGESTVEIGAHYLRDVLGLADHLAREQLRKFGFRFFFSEGRRDIERVTELGVSRALAVPSHQIDRGRFENFLGEEAGRRGVRFVDQAVVRALELGAGDGEPHRVVYTRGERTHVASARWLVDAAGRAAILKRKLGLEEPNAHHAHAVWFRVKTHLDVDGWSEDAAWRARCDPAARWLSTNHLVGAGYWVWLIPLASGSHSIGIVADPRLHRLEAMDSFERAMAWLQRYQPRLYDALDPVRDRLQDFAFFRRFSYGCKQVFSGRRWALVGEAGLFLDPFYSPGSDFIAIANTYVTELVALDRAGKPLAAHAQVYDRLYRSFYDSTLALYVDQYPILGDPEVLPVKIIWDYALYWGVLAQLFFHGKIADLAALAALREELAHCRSLNVALQPFLRAWSDRSRKRNPPSMLDQARLGWFADLNRSLLDRLDDRQFIERIRQSTRQLRSLALEILARALAEHPGLDASTLRRTLAQGERLGTWCPDGAAAASMLFAVAA
jgi:flavin-dependent dehydrogenase